MSELKQSEDDYPPLSALNDLLYCAAAVCVASD
jgi:hypothetical protein